MRGQKWLDRFSTLKRRDARSKHSSIFLNQFRAKTARMGNSARLCRNAQQRF
jgi:hypothetical protein